MIPPQALLILLLAIGLPICWVWSEYQERRWLRLLFGALSLIMCALIAVAVGSMDRLNSNAWYGTASAKLLETTIVEIEAGRTETLLAALRKLRGEFYPTYQGTAHYDQLIERFQAEVASAPTNGHAQ